MPERKPPALGRPAAGLPRYYMDCGWYRHPKFRGLPIEALFVFEAGVGYSTEHASDGLMAGDLEQLSLDLGIKHSTVRKGAAALIDRGAWRIEGDVIRIAGWADHNPTKGELDEYRQVKSKQGSYGNHRRWHVERNKPDPTCTLCVSEGLTANNPTDHPGSDIASDGSLANRMGWYGMGSSSERVATDPPTDPEPGAGEQSSRSDEDLLTATWNRLATHDLDQYLTADERHTIRNRTAWLKQAATQRRDRHEHQALAEIAGRTTPLDPIQLAEILDPTCGPDDGGAARARAAAEATAARAATQRAQAEAIAAWTEQADERLATLDDLATLQLHLEAAEGLPAGIPERARSVLIRNRVRRLAMGEPPDQAPDGAPAGDVTAGTVG